MNDHPIGLGENVIIVLSTISDGDMRIAGKSGDDLTEVYQNINKFLTENNFDANETVLVKADYSSDDFTQYAIVDKTSSGGGMIAGQEVVVADALATTVKNLGLFLPLADCLGAVIYDPEHKVLMVSHLGRHASEQFSAKKSIEFLRQNFKSDPSKILIWLSPSAGKENYPLYAFENLSLRDVNTEHFIEVGVRAENIIGGEKDTTTDENYYSYSEALKTDESSDKRFAIVAKMV
jgi:copper oxidase (laccase) domain-containing protein